MKRLIFLLVILLIGGVVVAQDTDTELVPFENPLFGIQGLVPDGWASAGPGVYARNPTEGDVAQLIIQSAPLPRVALVGALRGQLGIGELPEVETQLETDFAVWDVYRVDLDVQGYELTLSLAVADLEGVTYIAILQALREESPALHDAIFLPVIESLAAIVEETVEDAEKPYIEEEVTFSSGDITLAGTLSLPEGEGAFPAVILISGSGASDRDESLAPIAEIKPFRDIADHLARNGIAVLRYDERGVGESTGDIASATLQDFRDDASAAIDYLLSREEIDSAKVGIIGHSEGGMIAPEVALVNGNVAFVVGLGAPAVTMLETLGEQNRLAQMSLGANEEQIEAVLVALETAMQATLADDEAVLREAVVALIDTQLASRREAGQEIEVSEAMIAGGVAQFSAPIMRSYAEYVPADFWSALEIPVLAVYGSLDTQVTTEQNISVLEELTSDNDDVVIVTIEGMNHIFQKAETGVFAEYGTLEQVVMPELLDTISSWILGHFDD